MLQKSFPGEESEDHVVISIPKMCINQKIFSFRRSVQPKKNSNDDIIINEKPVEPDDIEIQ